MTKSGWTTVTRPKLMGVQMARPWRNRELFGGDPAVGNPLDRKVTQGVFLLDAAKHAERSGDLHKIREYLEQGADPDCRDNGGRTPLMIIAASGLSGARKREAADILLGHKASRDARDYWGKTAADHAAAAAEACRKKGDMRGARENTELSEYLVAHPYSYARHGSPLPGG